MFPSPFGRATATTLSTRAGAAYWTCVPSWSVAFGPLLEEGLIPASLCCDELRSRTDGCSRGRRRPPCRKARRHRRALPGAGRRGGTRRGDVAVERRGARRSRRPSDAECPLLPDRLLRRPPTGRGRRADEPAAEGARGRVPPDRLGRK